MNSKAFVEGIKSRAVDATSDGVVATLDQPAGRRPPAALVELSDWFHQLLPNDKEKVEKVIRYTADLAVYNFLAVLDGIAFFEPGNSKLKLYYEDGKAQTLLNDENDEQLTSLFKDLS